MFDRPLQQITPSFGPPISSNHHRDFFSYPNHDILPLSNSHARRGIVRLFYQSSLRCVFNIITANHSFDLCIIHMAS